MLNYYKMFEDVKDPVFSTKNSACFDVHAYFGNTKVGLIEYYNPDNTKLQSLAIKETHSSVATFTLHPRCRALIPTGLIFDIPEGYSIRGHARSGLAYKEGLILANSEAVIDADYVQQVYIIMINMSDRKLVISHEQKIAQLELVKCECYNLQRIETPPQQKTDRVGGFGSTGR